MKPTWFRVKRIHMIAGELVGVFNEPFFIEFHNDLLATDSTDIV